MMTVNTLHNTYLIAPSRSVHTCRTCVARSSFTAPGFLWHHAVYRAISEKAFLKKVGLITGYLHHKCKSHHIAEACQPYNTELSKWLCTRKVLHVLAMDLQVKINVMCFFVAVYHVISQRAFKIMTVNLLMRWSYTTAMCLQFKAKQFINLNFSRTAINRSVFLTKTAVLL